jgi:DNA-binding transcriptional LysR family regulator
MSESRDEPTTTDSETHISPSFGPRDIDSVRAMDMRTPLRRLEIFCLVVDEGGVTKAADRLFIVQPAVTAQLRALERSLKAVLFSRTGNSLVLTEAGERVYLWAKDVLAGCAQVQRDVEQLAAGDAGSLVVHASMAIGTYLLPPLVTRLRTGRTGASITVHIGEPAAAIRAAELGVADFAVVTLQDGAETGSLVANQLWEEPLVVGVGPNGPTIGESLTLAEAVRLPMVAAPQDVAYDRMLSAQLRRYGAGSPTVMIRLGHAEAIKQTAIDNGWACLIPGYVIASDVAAGRMRAVPIRDADLAERIGLYHRATKYFSPLQQAAVDALREFAAQQRTQTGSVLSEGNISEG